MVFLVVVLVFDVDVDVDVDEFSKGGVYMAVIKYNLFSVTELIQTEVHYVRTLKIMFKVR
jgi:hypothetical protein